MKLIRERTHYRVEVFEPGYLERRSTHEEIVRDLRTIAHAIQRHVDDVAAADVVWDTTVRCPFCNWEWEVDDEGLPICCQKAIDEWTGKEE